MKVGLGLAAGAALFIVVATANSGGYRYGISDQAFYIPAVAHAADPSLFPRDTSMLATQMRLWAGDEALGALVRRSGASLQSLFAWLYLLGLSVFFVGAVFLARGLSASWLAVATAAAFFTLRHRIAKTGVNSLEGYMHPRMIAFALGLVALGFLVRRKWTWAGLFVVLAGVVHPTTALWFGGATILGALIVGWRDVLRGWGLLWLVPLALGGWFIAVFLMWSSKVSPVTLAVLNEKDYLFSHEWPVYAWVINLLYPVVISAIYLRRRRAGSLAGGESVLVLGLLGLVGVFLVSVPMAATLNATVVRLQVNRVFWLLDALSMIYVAWWLVDDLAKSRPMRTVVVAIAVAVACGRGTFILWNTGRPLAAFDLPRDDWGDAMRWIRGQPHDWLVLADPGHAWKYGSSVRVAALRDTFLEQSKDSAMALYSDGARVAERGRALPNFDALTESQFQGIAQRYGITALVLERTRELALPRMYQNARFAIYNLR